jgi:FkbM family methyltransferase
MLKRRGHQAHAGVELLLSREVLSSHARRFVIRALKARFRDERAELEAIRRHVAATDTVCDIGANKGAFTFWLARWCRSGRVVAFEPQAGIAGRLASDCKSLNFSNVTVEPVGVYSKSGIEQLSVPRGHAPGAAIGSLRSASGEPASIPVRVVSLDDYFSAGEKLALLKIDVEGAELHVFKGAERILKTSRPLLVFECERRHLGDGSVDDVISYLMSLGYRGSFVCRGRLRPISEFDARVHQRAEGEWFWKSRDYCNNFIFSRM